MNLLWGDIDLMTLQVIPQLSRDPYMWLQLRYDMSVDSLYAYM